MIMKEFGDKLKKYSLAIQRFESLSRARDFTGTEAKLVINSGPGYEDEGGMSHDALQRSNPRRARRNRAMPAFSRRSRIRSIVRAAAARFKEWTVRLPDSTKRRLRRCWKNCKRACKATPLFPAGQQHRRPRLGRT